MAKSKSRKKRGRRPKRYRKVLGVEFTIRYKTTTRRGRREYMRKYMRLYRERKKKAKKRGKKKGGGK